MKKAMVFVIAVAFALTASIGAFAKDAKAEATPEVKIGYVDLNRALNEVNEGKAAKAKLEADGKAKKQKLEIMQKELQSMKEDLDKQRMILSKEALAEKEQKFQQKFLELQRTSLEFEKEFSEKEANFINPITVKLQKVVEKIGKSEGYTLIVPMAVFAMPTTDITDKVISAYNSSK